MKQSTKKMIIYAGIGLFLYQAIYGSYKAGSEYGQQLFPASTAANANSNLQLYGIGNPPNWY
jgi:hypothetical protein